MSWNRLITLVLSNLILLAARKRQLLSAVASAARSFYRDQKSTIWAFRLTTYQIILGLLVTKKAAFHGRGQPNIWFHQDQKSGDKSPKFSRVKCSGWPWTHCLNSIRLSCFSVVHKYFYLCSRSGLTSALHFSRIDLALERRVGVRQDISSLPYIRFNSKKYLSSIEMSTDWHEIFYRTLLRSLDHTYLVSPC